MPLFSRVSRLFRADVNAVLERGGARVSGKENGHQAENSSAADC